jgi:hypothetical protein
MPQATRSPSSSNPVTSSLGHADHFAHAGPSAEIFARGNMLIKCLGAPAHTLFLASDSAVKIGAFFERFLEMGYPFFAALPE